MSTALLPEPSLQRAHGDPMLPLRATVRRRRRELADTWTLELDVADGRLGRFEPGQFNMLWAFGVGEAAISISGDPAADGPLVHTIRDVGKVSGALARLRVGDSLGIRGPFGTAWPVEAAYGRDVVVVAGGLGLAPLRPAIYQLFRERHRFGRISILYGTRNPAQILYPAELERWRRRLDVEIAVCEVHAEMGTIPEEAAREIAEKASFYVDPDFVSRVNEIEKITLPPAKRNAILFEESQGLPWIKLSLLAESPNCGVFLTAPITAPARANVMESPQGWGPEVGTAPPRPGAPFQVIWLRTADWTGARAVRSWADNSVPPIFD